MDTTLFKFLFLFPASVFSSSFHLKDECPSDVTEWNKAKLRLKCSYPDIYHCLLDDKGRLGEICLKEPPLRVQKGFCPRYNRMAGITTSIPCRALRRCPSNPFDANEVYMYPACLQTDFKKITILPLKEQQSIISTDQPAINTQQSTESVQSFVVILPVVYGILLLAFGIFICLWYTRKKKAPRDTRQSGASEGVECVAFDKPESEDIECRVLEPLLPVIEIPIASDIPVSKDLDCPALKPLLPIIEIPIEFNNIVRCLDANIFVQSEKYRNAVGALETFGWIILIGPPGSGKTMTAIHLARRKLGQVSPLEKKYSVHFCQNLRDVSGLKNGEEEPYIILDDLMEKYIYYPLKLADDRDIFDEVFETFIKPGLVHVLITVKEDTWNKLKDTIISEDGLFSKKAAITLGKTWNKEDKEAMIENHLRINNIDETHIANEKKIKPNEGESSKVTESSNTAAVVSKLAVKAISTRIGKDYEDETSKISAIDAKSFKGGLHPLKRPTSNGVSLSKKEVKEFVSSIDGDSIFSLPISHSPNVRKYPLPWRSSQINKK